MDETDEQEEDVYEEEHTKDEDTVEDEQNEAAAALQEQQNISRATAASLASNLQIIERGKLGASEYLILAESCVHSGGRHEKILHIRFPEPPKTPPPLFALEAAKRGRVAAAATATTTTTTSVPVLKSTHYPRRGQD